MANSVVKVTDIKDDQLSDNLFILIGGDGTVAPDQETVETFLKQRNGPTNIQLMKINKTEKQNIDITVDNVTYMPDVINEEIVNADVSRKEVKPDMDEVARNLYNFRLDHDYTPLLSPRGPTNQEDDLVKTLSILDGPEHRTVATVDLSEPPPLILSSKPKAKAKVNIIQSITIPPPAKQTRRAAPPVLQPVVPQTPPDEKVESPQDDSEKEEPPSLEPMVPIVTPKEQSNRALSPGEDISEAGSPTGAEEVKPRAKVIKIEQKVHAKPERVKVEKNKTRIVKEIVEEESDDENEDFQEDFEAEIEDDENDSDYDFEKEIKPKQTPRRTNRRGKSETKPFPKTRTKLRSLSKGNLKDDNETSEIKESENNEKVVDKKIAEEVEKPVDKDGTETIEDQKLEAPEATKAPEKKPKRKKEPPKPLVDDFALFSTPDIIRRVGGKEPVTPNTPLTPDALTPVKPAKITPESRAKSADQSPSPKHNTSNRTSLDQSKLDKEKHSGLHAEQKSKERRSSSSEIRSRHLSTEEKLKLRSSDFKRYEKHHSKSESESGVHSEGIQNSEDLHADNLNQDGKSFANNSMPIDSELSNSDPNNINLDATGLDIDPSLLDNLNNDEISEDILYQVAKSLVSNPEIQNAIDKGINEGVLDPMPVEQNVVTNQTSSTQDTSANVIQKGTQIVRPDGRIVVIPPIERPTTRSRGKKKEEEKPVFKPTHKPLDDEHVSGNELDSSNDEEEESEDDPNKLWCICNQPHNNRFMICCDTCEEWYHGKCVNITKTMGQQMEAEGKEWICLFCKDPTLKRPQAAARRVRKASRNSRASTDSAGSSQKTDASVSCVVCQKPARKSSIYCSETCILAHAQGIERVVVFERSTGKMLMGNKAPSAANLDQWLKEHPGYEVVRSGGKVVTAKAGTLTQSKLKLVKNTEEEGVSLAIQKKGVNIGVLKHAPKHSPSPQSQQSPKQQTQQTKPPLKASATSVKIGNKQIVPKDPILPKDVKPKAAQSQMQSMIQTPPNKQKVVQPVQVKTPQSAEKKPKIVSPQIKSPMIKEKQIPKDKTPKIKPKPETPPTPQPKPQENIRENVQKTVLEQLTNRLKGSEDIKLTEDELKSVSTEIEEQLFKCFGDTGQKYRNKYRSLIFNIKDTKNHTLWRRICEKSISPYELVRLSPDDMASQELAKWRENEAKHSLDMIKKSELELLNCNRQYVLKTHKGEQVLEDDRGDKVDNTEVIKSLTEGSTLDGDDGRSDSSRDRDKKGSSKHSHKDKEKGRERRSTRSYRSSSRERDRSRRRSRSRDRKHGDHKKHSRDRDRDRHRKSLHKSSRHKKDIISTTDKLDKRSKEILEQLVDNKIVPPLEDRLWKHVPQEDIVPGKAIESDSDHEPSSTVTIPTPPRSQDEENLPVSPEKEKDLSVLGERSMSPPPKSKPVEIWRGVINMIDVAQISITAHEVSGDCTGLGKELADNLDIVGRISPDTVWEYIGKMKCSNSKGISLLRLNATNMEEKMPYLALYSYLSSRDRLGVVKSTNKAVKDFYIYPLAPQKPIPQVLLPINGPGFEESRPALLLGIVVRDKRKARSYIEPILPSELYPKKQKMELPRSVTPPISAATPPTLTRSYTPPPLKDPRLKLSLPPPTLTPITPDEGDEPYSPEDSNPEPPVLMEQPPLPLVAPPPPPNLPPVLTPAISSLPESVLPAAPFAGLPGSSGLPSTTLEIQRQMEELNKKIEMQKSEITSMTKTIVSASTEIGTSALANISLPSNLQQILENIKMIGENTESSTPVKEVSQSDFTIPLMIPKSFSRPLSNPLSVPPPSLTMVPPPSIGKLDLTNDTIPLNLPSKPKIKPHSVNSPLLEEKPTATGSVLGSLSEEDLIRKASEMLGEDAGKPTKKRQETEAPPTTPAKRSRQEISLPPVPGLEDDIIL